MEKLPDNTAIVMNILTEMNKEKKEAKKRKVLSRG